ncbi:hypothetical protein [Pseudomonas sp. PS01301]|uniref:hypothetical protein n=1 Tax=Pseudomonas sp. PS01301 TaxID=2991437 RepID=UPI00249CCE9E|nr:hypothetical protein [Pseudomonas sp. PS01301]
MDFDNSRYADSAQARALDERLAPTLAPVQSEPARITPEESAQRQRTLEQWRLDEKARSRAVVKSALVKMEAFFAPRPAPSAT